ncbi:hypothetical protein dqs_1429 [Azoarcus olearius]|uniref:type VI secretion system baseplate subunit TssG n=1 Tax=Azoarcus sp. (strain BH72) TaxID=418699 RepID=UPI00080642E5|nr:type VI secretion system baseplate subunit TssG [Azoarcus olearius]ANQ84477.1 hypothetical protein dqs_1429 [Azoarcus olearius]
MATPQRRSDRDLSAELAAEPHCFGFFQAVRLLELISAAAGHERPVRFRAALSLAFPPSELAAATVPAGAAGERPMGGELSVAFMGLTGPSGVLPHVYTEMLLERNHLRHDGAAGAFLDLFNHRALALFHEGWRKYRHWLAAERAGTDRFAEHLLDLCGLGPAALASIGGGETPARLAFLRYAGLLAQRPLSAHALETVIAGVLGVTVRIESFSGRWMVLPEAERSRLGTYACGLGSEACSGDRVWDAQGAIRLRVGPVRRQQFETLLPGGAAARMLAGLIRYAVGHALACTVVVVLDRRDIPQPRLGADAPLSLGSNLWFEARAREDDADDLRYALLD